MTRSKSSKQWLRDHFNDAYVKKSKYEGYRSRASYKLLEIQRKDNFIKPGMTVVDLGAAPGGWSQVAAELVGDRGRVIASDILPMDIIANVEFVQGNFTEQGVLDKLVDQLRGSQVDLVISDMAPNMSGMKGIDQPQAMNLAELALDMSRSVLKPGANFLVKVFQGEGFESFRQELRETFRTVKTRKPAASRTKSSEIYLLAGDYFELS
ncbi:MAG TPA: 23S rRNA (uridine(2552)-2'-O)-methyltransferase RlmE [Gammaproteobacteria bacterium]|nr:23S rRNA (uridine(2552)-2'-O)-methyltransferase RlmE [Gammaproteobacteria bacterium]|tara:strand:+ start:5064 stop:5690 length:627 start_codon:yes stop_codon:yes gene_type:complete